MQKLLLVFFIVASFLLGFPHDITAQDFKSCGSVEAMERFLREHPELVEKIKQEKQTLRAHTQSYIANQSPQEGQRSTVYIIPVVFHIIHNYGTENISDNQVKDAVRILNEDFRKINLDTADIIDEFKSIAGDSEIEFRLAQKDPSGNCTNGIDRIASIQTYVGDDGSKLNPWPRNKYLNIWIVKTISSGAAGYAYYPSNWTGSNDGIVILHNYVGSIGTGDYTRSRALTHEVGHYLNLKHTWGDSNNPGLDGTVTTSNPTGIDNCNDDDDVTDTPNTRGWTSCNLYGSSCSSIENLQNHMDYAYCSKMFSEGQGDRMQAALNSAIAQRNNLWTAGNLNATGTNGTDILCKAEFVSNRTVVCAGERIDFTDNSYIGQTSWNWSFPGATPSSEIVQNPSVTYSTPGTYNVMLTVSDGVSSESTTKTGYITVLADTGRAMPVTEGLESVSSLPDNNWLLLNQDGLTTWAVSSGAAASGSKSLKLNNVSNPISQVDEFISTTVDLSSLSAVNLTFKVAFAQKNTSDNDKLLVSVSNNCGQSWAGRWSKSGSLLATAPVQTTAFTPGASQWTEYTITNIPSSYLTEDFRLKFQFTSGGGNNIYIDDINLYDPATVDMTENVSSNLNFMVFPNPVEENTIITFNLMEQQNVLITLTDILGRNVSIINNGDLNAGEHRFNINNKDMALGKGIYIVKLVANERLFTKKLIVN